MSKQHGTLSEIMDKIQSELNQNSEPISGVNTIYQFDISGDAEGSFQLRLQDGTGKVVLDVDQAADCTLVMSFDSFQKFLTGKLNGTMAFMTGKLKINGDLTKAIKLEAILKQYNFSD
ncbi:putative sterol carrier protein [Bacillus mesophilus]|uniref:SCP2 sterol-binding domain-containing protein n=1 Tax=Bacillus mesophilus TaxID=1808955 RepID=A0A6M0Q8T5_9BACI|nr:SCP2 sterol-binding domain-containing protein [Bacillus mesophilus]MBM7661873.1 putative sterol carrier protein [Bacillus mesophilus]NEY72765.1 SCP2 sterol-binding domain-containing protein [Bacillus mesophilus]